MHGAVIHRGRAMMPPKGGAPIAPHISSSVTVSWAWTDQSKGNISWTFVNSDTSNAHTVVLYRNNYIFGGAFWPIYLGPDAQSHMLDGTQPIPTLTSPGGQPMAILDYGAGASPRYLVHFIFNIGPGQTWSTPEGGFLGGTVPTAGVCYSVTNPVAGNFSVGYDPQRVIDWDNQLGNSDQGFSPNPKTFYTYAFQPESATPENELGYNDSIAPGTTVATNFYVVTNKNNFGRDEVQDTKQWANAFYLFLEGYTPVAVGSATPVLSGSWNNGNIPGLGLNGPTITYDVGNTGPNATVVQRIRFAYEVDFTTASLGVFPAPGGTPGTYMLGASITVQGIANPVTPKAEFFLLGGDDPYFTNVNSGPGAGPTEFYLSQDLRVFTGTPGLNSTPVSGPGAPTLSDSFAEAYVYIGQLVTWLNQQYGYLNATYAPPDTNVSDPLDGLLPEQGGALNGDSSVTPKTGTYNNYNFAIARVRLRGSSGVSAEATNVKVFFRMFATQTLDTDWINVAAATTSADPNVTYPTSGGVPQPGTDKNGQVNGSSLPFFATKNFVDGPIDYNALAVNNQTIEIPAGQDYAWAFYGCFLNVNDASNVYGGKPVQEWLAGSSHSCLVAEINYSDAPIENANGLIANPEWSDKLAQRNLQVSTSGNPGYPATHRVPQTMDMRPSLPPTSSDPTNLLSYPDEMMIDWGQTPVGSTVTMYWPEVSASTVLQLAATLYPAQPLTMVDAHTIQLQVTGPVSFVPIPAGAGGSYAGLITLTLPPTVKVGREFDITIKRITTRQVVVPPAPPVPPAPRVMARRAGPAPEEQLPQVLMWRYVSGSIGMKIAVEQENKILPVDENLLAILKWRLGLIGPSNRWYPVILRWIGVLTGRIDGMGGDAGTIPGSANGYQPIGKGLGGEGAGRGRGFGHGGLRCWTGKVLGVQYDRFGDFEGFELQTEAGEAKWFRGRERAIEEIVLEAWKERRVVRVCVEEPDAEWPRSITLVRPH
jgi:hypothetical protein